MDQDVATSPHDASANPGADPGRDRMLSVLIVLVGLGLFLALPFVLSAGAVFFVPLLSALVLGIVLWPLADLFVRWGVPNALSAALAIVFLFVLLSVAFLLILQPAIDLVAQLPRYMTTIGGHIERLQGGLSGLSQITEQVGRITGASGRETVVIATPSFLEQAALATPSVMFEIVLTLLMAYFVIEGRVRMRRSLLLERADFGSSLRAARTLRDMQVRVGAYISTVAAINLMVGVVVALGAWALGMEAPVMWGGLAALLNFLPYIGPLAMTALLAAYGLGTATTVVSGLLPPLLYLGLHTAEANAITPQVLGRRFTLNPLSILIAISYFSWIWGAIGALLSVPVLITLTVLFEHLGKPHLVGFLFGEPLFEPPNNGSLAEHQSG